MELKDIVMKLVGKVDPIGETQTDNQRLENLKVLCNLVNDLVKEIDDVSYRNKDRYEYSRKIAGQYADNFLGKTLGISD